MSRKVLIVDDSAIIHKLLRKVIESIGFEVCGDAKNGAEGVEMYRTLKPDLVFMDATMPVLDGLEATKQIKALDSSAHIIMLTAMGDDEFSDEALEAGVEQFLKKPFDDYKIVNAISKILF